MSAATAFYKPAKQADWYKSGGSKYRQDPDDIDRLPKGLQNRALVMWRCIMRFLARGELDPMNATNPAMVDDIPYGETFAKEGLRILREPYALVETAGGDFERVELPPFIVVERKHGRRKILPGIGLYKKPEKETDSKPAPLCTPPPQKRKDEETTTTGGGSSSSLASLPGDGTELPAELLEAIGLVPDLSRERLLGWVHDYGAELARRGVEYLRVGVCRRENPVREARWAEAALESWKAKLDHGLRTMEDIDAEIEIKRRRWGRRASAAEEESKRAKAKADAAREKEEATKAKAREDRLREKWGLLSEGEREAIRAEVNAANPGLLKWPNLLEPLYLAELEKRQSAEEPRPP
jgi:hypothetical protein